MTNLHRQKNEKFIEGKVNISNPFRASKLPLIVQLYRMAFHKYKRRGTKRLFKRPARLLFDFAYHVLRLKGNGTLTFKTRWGTQNLRFNGRNGQFGGVYTFPDNHIFEAPLIGLMWTLLRGDDVFFDIGANWGCISLHAATFSEYQGEIHSFEPVPETFADLDSLVQQAQLNDRIHCHQVALSNRSGVGTMILPDPAQSGWAKISGDGLGFQVPFTRLDDMDLPNPKFLKIDVEGHELEVLKGAETTLRRSKAFIVFESWLLPQNPGKTAAPWQFLADLGYVFFCPAWRSKDDTSLITVSNMPTGKNREFQLVLIPCELEHRMFGPEQWSYLACHGDRCDELAGALTKTP